MRIIGVMSPKGGIGFHRLHTGRGVRKKSVDS